MERFTQYITATRAALFFSLLGTICLVYGLIYTPESEINYPSKSIVSSNTSTTNNADIKAYITGAVNKPGVYALKPDDRVADLIQKAGGFTDKASQIYVSKYLNLAQKVSDGHKVYIPSMNERYDSNNDLSSTSGLNATDTTINLNSATANQLDQLPGVGTVTANKIINSRPYLSTQDLINKKVVNTSVYDKIKNLISAN